MMEKQGSEEVDHNILCTKNFKKILIPDILFGLILSVNFE